MAAEDTLEIVAVKTRDRYSSLEDFDRIHLVKKSGRLENLVSLAIDHSFARTRFQTNPHIDFESLCAVFSSDDSPVRVEVNLHYHDVPSSGIVGKMESHFNREEGMSWLKLRNMSIHVLAPATYPLQFWMKTIPSQEATLGYGIQEDFFERPQWPQGIMLSRGSLEHFGARFEALTDEDARFRKKHKDEIIVEDKSRGFPMAIGNLRVTADSFSTFGHNMSGFRDGQPHYHITHAYLTNPGSVRNDSAEWKFVLLANLIQLQSHTTSDAWTKGNANYYDGLTYRFSGELATEWHAPFTEGLRLHDQNAPNNTIKFSYHRDFWFPHHGYYFGTNLHNVRKEWKGTSDVFDYLCLEHQSPDRMGLFRIGKDGKRKKSPILTTDVQVL